MKNQRMEIKVALLGNVSAGKTTVLNAILQNKYGEVAKKRTTAAANYFYVNVRKDVGKLEEGGLAEIIHQEVMEDNVKKLGDGHEMTKKTFEIETAQPIVRCREDTVLVLVDIPGINEAGTENKYKEFVSNNWTTFDCVIAVMDGKQGVNTEDQVFLLKFLLENSQKKDVPVIILCNKIDDPLEEEQAEIVNEASKEVQKIFGVECLELSLQSTLDKYRNREKFDTKMSPAFIPVSAGNAFIYRCGIQMTLQQFQNFDKAILDSFGRSQFGQKAWNILSPEQRIEKVFSLISDHDQYIDGMKESNFDTFLKVLDMFVGGKDQQALLLQQQVHLALSSMDAEPFSVGTMTNMVRDAFRNLSALGALNSSGGVIVIQNCFWKSHKQHEDSCFKQFRDSWPEQNVEVLVGPMKELFLYCDLVIELQWHNEKQNIMSRAEAWIHRYFKFLLGKNLEHNHSIAKGITRAKERQQTITFDHLFVSLTKDKDQDDIISGNRIKFTSYDWILILDSILLLSYNELFCVIFGQIKSELNIRLHIALKDTDMPSSCPNCFMALTPLVAGNECSRCKVVYVESIPTSCMRCHRKATHSGYQSSSPNDQYNASREHFDCCRFKYHISNYTMISLQRHYGQTNDLVPVKVDVYGKMAHVNIPQSLDDPSHYAHLPLQFCRLAKRLSSDN